LPGFGEATKRTYSDNFVVPIESRRLMSTLSPTRQQRELPVYLAWLAWLFVAACAVGVLSFLIFGTGGDRSAAVIMLAAGLLVAAGLYAFRRSSPWLAVGLIAVGAVAGGAMLVWTIAAPIAAIALIVLSTLRAVHLTSPRHHTAQ
jgi:hypothetical protein